MSDITLSAEPLPPIATLEDIWRGLDGTGAHSFFLTWSWIGTWLKTLPPSVRPMLLRATRAGELAGLALLTPRRGRLRGLIPVRQAWLNATGDPAFDCLTVEHNGFAVSGAGDSALVEALERSFRAGGIAADELVLPGIPAGHQAVPRPLDRERASPAFRAPLEGAREGIEPLLSRNARQQIRRAMRAWERKGPLSVEVAGDAETALAYFERMKELHMRSWKRRRRRHAFTHPFFEVFHRALIVDGFAGGGVDLMRISAGTHVLGYLHNFRRNGTVSSYQSGFDDTVPDLRPGYVCHALAMAHYAAEGMAQYDFLAGTNRLKQSFGPEQYEMCWRRLRKPKAVFQAEALLRRGVKMATGKM
jgi:CelD/BcsL family acetyltransferase involved in cellulose biosynthesis